MTEEKILEQVRRKLCSKIWASGKRGCECDMICINFFNQKRKPKFYKGCEMHYPPKNRKLCYVCKELKKLTEVKP